jgi:hypothetical protein
MFRIPKIQFTDHIKPKKKDQSVDASVLLRRNKRLTRTKYGDNVWNRDSRKDPPETAPLGDPSQI